MVKTEKSNDIEKIIAEIARKDETETRTFFANHDEDHSYQGVLVNRRMTQFYIRPRIQNRRIYNAPVAYNAKFLDFILDFDVSRWTDVPEPELKEKYKTVRRDFIAECDKIHADDVVEITYSKDSRCKHLKDVCGENVNCYAAVPLIYYPLGFETYTSSYAREGQILPEVTCVKVIDESEKFKSQKK